VSAFDAYLGDKGLQENFAHEFTAIRDVVLDSGALDGDVILGGHLSGAGSVPCFQVVSPWQVDARRHSDGQRQGGPCHLTVVGLPSSTFPRALVHGRPLLHLGSSSSSMSVLDIFGMDDYLRRVEMRALLRTLVGVVAMAGAVTFLPSAAGANSTPPQLVWPQAGAATPSATPSYDFGTLDASQGQTATQNFTLTNIGGRATGALTISLSPSSVFTITADNCTGTSLSGNHHNSCQVSVTYAPIGNGESDSATLTADGKMASASLSLTGASTTPGGSVVVPGGWNRVNNKQDL